MQVLEQRFGLQAVQILPFVDCSIQPLECRVAVTLPGIHYGDVFRVSARMLFDEQFQYTIRLIAVPEFVMRNGSYYVFQHLKLDRIGPC